MGDRMLSWSLQYRKGLLGLCVVSLTLLFFAFLTTSVIKVLPGYLLVYMHSEALVTAGFVALSVAPRGLVPVVICILGVVLIHNAIILPLYATPEKGEAIVGGQKFEWTFYSEQAVQVAGMMHFFLGMSMVIFGMIIAHRPSMLFTRNRPKSADEEWSKYPIWQSESVVAVGKTGHAVALKNMLTEQDRRLLWRYEYLLVEIYGTAHLADPEAIVPWDSTKLLREGQSGRLLGKARYAGFFI
jgi:hypothetical protein